MTKDFIEDTLIGLGVPSAKMGFDYIVRYLLMLENNDSRMTSSEMYAVIAAERNKNAAAIERAIRYAFYIARQQIKADGIECSENIFSGGNATTLHRLYYAIKSSFKEKSVDTEKCTNEKRILISMEELRSIVAEEVEKQLPELLMRASR